MMSFLRSEKKDNGWAMSHAKDDEKVENPSNFGSTDDGSWVIVYYVWFI